MPTLGKSLPRREGYTVNCPCCGLREWNRSGSVRGADLSRCCNCGLLGTTHFLNGTKTTDLLYEVGAEEFREYRERYLPSRLEVYRRFLPGIDKFREGNRLLEVGAGYGYFLEMALAAGWAAEGVEISRYCCEMARSRGSTVHHGELQDLPASNPPYDVIVMWDVIEHFTQPLQVVSACRNLLRKGGALLMRTPNGQALNASRTLGRIAYRNLAYPANTAEHVFHFKPKELTSIVEQMGFEARDVDCIAPWKEYVISGNNSFVISGRWLVMRYAHRRGWPYEFVLTAVKK